MSELNASQPTSYFTLHADGCGYLNRVRTVPSGIPITSAISRELNSSTLESANGCRSSSGRASMRRWMAAFQPEVIAACSGFGPDQAPSEAGAFFADLLR